MNKLNTFDYFIKVANTWLKDLEEKNEDDILINPAKGQWSISELYDHIIKVARSYQIPNFKKSMTSDAERKAGKNFKAFMIFTVGVKKVNTKIRMEDFPAALATAITPVKQNKAVLITDFKLFIKEVTNLKEELFLSTKKNKHYHPFFGDISSKEWFTLIGFHIMHHEKQKKRINEFLTSR